MIATGGPSIPKMGATGFAYDLARQFGLEGRRAAARAGAADPRAATDVLFRELSGVSAESWSRAPARRRSARRRCSPIAACPARRSCRSPPTGGTARRSRSTCCPIGAADWLAAQARAAAHATSTRCSANCCRDRLAEALAEADRPRGELANLPDDELREAERRLADWRFRPNGTEGFAKAEVTAGGIDTADLSSQTMEARNVPGLYVIGEAVDVTGWLGGYNFQWAWASGWAAAQVL